LRRVRLAGWDEVEVAIEARDLLKGVVRESTTEESPARRRLARSVSAVGGSVSIVTTEPTAGATGMPNQRAKVARAVDSVRDRIVGIVAGEVLVAGRVQHVRVLRIEGHRVGTVGAQPAAPDLPRRSAVQAHVDSGGVQAHREAPGVFLRDGQTEPHLAHLATRESRALLRGRPQGHGLPRLTGEQRRLQQNGREHDRRQAPVQSLLHAERSCPEPGTTAGRVDPRRSKGEATSEE
jgi:hypothetical protein